MCLLQFFQCKDFPLTSALLCGILLLREPELAFETWFPDVSRAPLSSTECRAGGNLLALSFYLENIIMLQFPCWLFWFLWYTITIRRLVRSQEVLCGRIALTGRLFFLKLDQVLKLLFWCLGRTFHRMFWFSCWHFGILWYTIIKRDWAGFGCSNFRFIQSPLTIHGMPCRW